MEHNHYYNDLTEESLISQYIYQDGQFKYVNPAFSNLFGYNREELLSNKIKLENLLLPESYYLVLEKGLAFAQSEQPFRLKGIKKDGSMIHIEVHSKLIYDNLKIMGSIIDVTTQVNLEEHLKLSEKRYESFFYYNTDMIYDIDLNGTIIAMNPACKRVAGYQPDEVIGESFTSFIVDEHMDKAMYHFSEALNGFPQQFDIAIWDKDGNRVDLSCSSIPIIINEVVIGVYGIGKDITKIKRAEEQATFLAYYDPLTNLPNRRLFESRFSEIRTNKKLAVMFIDIDHFKQVNDSFGHKIGDQLIQLVATRLKNQVRDADTVARLGGDEFTILLPNIKDDKEPLEIAERIIKTMKTPFIIDGLDLTTTSSIGITISAANVNYQTLIQQADIAMYKAKSYGRNGYALYSKEMDEYCST